MDAKEIAKKLRKLRGLRSRKTVADSLGISVSALAMYECGKRIPKDEMKIKIADYFGKTVEEIFFEK